MLSFNSDSLLKIALTSGIIFWCYKIFAPFITLISWSIIFAVTVYPVFKFFQVKTEKPKLSAILVVILLLLSFLTPVYFISGELVQNITLLIKSLRVENLNLPDLPDFIPNLPLVGESIASYWVTLQDNFFDVIKNFKTEIRKLSTTILKTFTNIGLNLLEISIAAILSSFILVYSNSLVTLFKKTFIRVNNEKGAEIFNLVGMTIQNIAIGVIGVASVQAIIAAIGFIIIGIPAPGILALLVLFFSSIQIGPGVVIIPTIIYAWFTFDFTPSLIYTIWSIPVMLFDNVLKPIVMSRGLSTPMILIIVGLIGGTLLHGLIGLFIGPIILGVAYQLYKVWINES